MSEKINAKIITPIFRGSFVNVIKPKAFSKDQEPKYSIVISIEKENKFWKELDEKIKAVAVEKWGEVPKKLKTFIKDGDDEEEKYGWEGTNVFTASNKNPVGILMKTDQGMIEPTNGEEDIYSGAYYRASIRPYAYEYQNTKGVAISLDNLLKVTDGEKFTAKTSAKEDFKEFIDEDEWDD